MSAKISDRKLFPRRLKKGFTLLELVVAVGILSIALVVIIRGYVVTLRALEHSSGRAAAFMLAENLLAEYELEGDFSPGEDSGRFEGEFEGFFWEMSAVPLSYEGEVFDGILRVEFSVYRAGEEGVKVVTFVEDLN